MKKILLLAALIGASHVFFEIWIGVQDENLLTVA